MTCRKYRKQLIPWLDGELRADRAAELDTWFASCDTVRHCSVCRKLAEDYKRIDRSFQSTPQSEFPAYLHHRIMDRVKTEAVILHKREVRSRWQTIPVAIAIAMSLYVGSLIGISTIFDHSSATNTKTELYTFGENSVINDFNASGGTQ